MTAYPLLDTHFIKLSISGLVLKPGIHSSLSIVPPVNPSPLPAIIGIFNPSPAITGARIRDTLSPIPPVECLSATKSLESEKSSVFPDLSITSTSENISSSSIPLKYIAISIADIWASVTLPIRYPLKNSSTSLFFRLNPSRFFDIRFEKINLNFLLFSKTTR